MSNLIERVVVDSECIEDARKHQSFQATAGFRDFARFFFQAEDGIRDLVRSRGLGDVYKGLLHLQCILSPLQLFQLNCS